MAVYRDFSPRLNEPPIKSVRDEKSGDSVARIAKAPLPRRGWPSPLTRRILVLNVLVLLIPVMGLLHLESYRATLIEAELESLRIQGQAFSLTLGSSAVIASRVGRERLLPEMTRHLMRLLLTDGGVRARLFAPDGRLLADSFMLVGPGGQVQVVELPPPDQSSALGRELEQMYNNIIDWLPGSLNLPEYREAAVQSASDYPEVLGALSGDAPGMVRSGRNGELVLSVALPVQRYRQVLGALMVSKDGTEIDQAVRARRLDILIVFGVALGVTILLSFYLAGTIARPIHRLALAASRVRYGTGRQFEIPDFSRRGDEIGDLSSALHDMTAALWQRLDAIEGFAADVAHEIKNPLTSLRSAVETAARIEDPEQQRKLMSIILDDVQRLDRLISDISDASRLDAELSRADTEPVDVSVLLHTLAEVYEAALSEQDLKIVFDLERQRDLMVAGIEGRLGQVFRNIIANAISFSPKGGTIKLTASRDNKQVIVTVSDEGPGIPPGKLGSIFDRFYSERPKEEKFGTHSGLGLSISRRIIEAHGGVIRAENRLGPRQEVIGARFIVELPAK